MMWETNRHMDKETNRQMDSKIMRHTYRKTNRCIDKKARWQMDRKTHWHMDKKQTDRYIINKQQGLTLYSTIYLKQWNIRLLML